MALRGSRFSPLTAWLLFDPVSSSPEVKTIESDKIVGFGKTACFYQVFSTLIENLPNIKACRMVAFFFIWDDFG